ncbi:MAG: hypothetical protein ACTMHX_07295, partial [Bifidobacterium mongoliense]
FVYVAGNLATDPRVQRFPAKDGMYDEVVWLTVAVNHTDAATEYVELEARGKTKEYIATCGEPSHPPARINAQFDDTAAEPPPSSHP